MKWNIWIVLISIFDSQKCYMQLRRITAILNLIRNIAFDPLGSRNWSMTNFACSNPVDHLAYLLSLVHWTHILCLGLSSPLDLPALSSPLCSVWSVDLVQTRFTQPFQFPMHLSLKAFGPPNLLSQPGPSDQYGQLGLLSLLNTTIE